jgi:hypothetical protein
MAEMGRPLQQVFQIVIMVVIQTAHRDALHIRLIQAVLRLVSPNRPP